MFRLNSPVAFFIFKRPETTRRVFEVIASARPPQLFVVADGPRNADEASRCEAARAIIDRVNWDCDVVTDYSNTNLGLKRRIASGLDWVFEQVEEAIILEDDCLPDPTFFRFCQELLDVYRDDSRVMHISGDNFLRGTYRFSASYYFSRYPHVWGWATWRRAWQNYDVYMTLWTQLPEHKHFLDQFVTARERRFWREIWDNVSAGRIDTWDYQWVFACVAHDGLAIMPDRNLVSNIGFGRQATHTSIEGDLSALPVKPMAFPLVHPTLIAPDLEADRRTADIALLPPRWGKRIRRKLKRLRRALCSP
jgi:hypothetical protein